MFNEKQAGKGYQKVGEYVPNRATNFSLNRTSCLVQMLGFKEMRTDKHGSNSPLLIKIQTPTGEDDKIDSMLFTDLNYIVQQLYNFSYCSERSFLAEEEPITMKYSTLIAKALGKLRKIEGWESDIVNSQLKYYKWFL